MVKISELVYIGRYVEQVKPAVTLKSKDNGDENLIFSSQVRSS